ncbi:MAG: hypothetical protein KDG52_12260 [Rhodocyclaceae bacterium]|nr:hypothetical protein [Rhodocyclaceae bacterium]
MSLLFRSEFCAALAPGRIELTRLAYGLRRRLEAWRRADLSPAAGDADCWRFVLEGLASMLQGDRPVRGRLKVVLSSHWVRFQVIPWNPEIGSPAEFAGYARACFERVYGEAAANWEIRFDEARTGCGRMACAIDRELIDGIARVTREAGCRLSGVQPYLMHAFNPLALPLGRKRFLFVLAERGRVTIAAGDRGGWTAVRNCSVTVDEDGLRDLVERELKLLGGEAQPEVIIHAPRIAAEKLEAVEALGWTLVPAAGATDYAMAWGTGAP